MSREKELAILINDGCTARGAKELLALGTTIFAKDDEATLKELFNFTIEDIEAGKSGDIVASVFEGEKYYIAYAN